MKQNTTGKEIFTRVVRKKVNAKAASHSSALIFYFMWAQCCKIAKKM